MTLTTAAIATARWFASPTAILGVPIACAAWLYVWDVASLTLALSILAITMTQLVLLAAGVRDTAMHKKLDGIVEGVPGAPNELIGIEEKGE